MLGLAGQFLEAWHSQVLQGWGEGSARRQGYSGGECRAAAGMALKNDLLQMLLKCPGEAPKPWSLSILPDVTAESGGKVLIRNLLFHRSLENLAHQMDT